MLKDLTAIDQSVVDATIDETVEPGRRTRVRAGLLPMIGAAGAMAAAMVWTLSANDPYWRLYGEPVPAPDYEAAGAAANLGPDSDPLAQVPRPSPALAVVNRTAATISEPTVIMVPLSYYPQPDMPQNLGWPGAVSDQPAPGIAMAARSATDLETDVAIMLAPLPMPEPADPRDAPALRLADARMSPPTVAALVPVRPHFAATESSEDALTLNRSDRVDVQRRLALAGFDPHGLDGVFGERTRGAIRDFQVAWGYPETGYLEPAVYADLNQRTEEAYQALSRRAAAAPRSAPQLAPAAREREVAVAEPGACPRNEYGQIIARQSLKCDLVGFSEGFVSLGRDTIDDDEADARLTGRAGAAR